MSETVAGPVRRPPGAGSEGQNLCPKSHCASEPLDLAVVSVPLRTVEDPGRVLSQRVEFHQLVISS
jgi:hypothetical protein